MGRTSSEVKDRYNRKAYDQLIIRMPKGNKQKLRKEVEAAGYESVNRFVTEAIEFYLEEVNKHPKTGKMVAAIMGTGQFTKLTASKYTDSGDYLLTGDIMDLEEVNKDQKNVEGKQ